MRKSTLKIDLVTQSFSNCLGLFPGGPRQVDVAESAVPKEPHGCMKKLVVLPRVLVLLWNQICQICCMLHVRIHVKLVVISKSCQWSIPWLLPGLSCWAHKGTFCISCNVSKHVQTPILCAFHGRHPYFNIHFNTRWSVFRCDGQACFRGSRKRSTSSGGLVSQSNLMLVERWFQFNVIQLIHCFTWSSHTVSGRQVFMVFFAPLSLDLKNHAKRCSPSFICKPIGWYQLIFGNFAQRSQTKLLSQ